MPVVMRDGKKLNKKEYGVGTIKDKDGKTIGQITAPGVYTFGTILNTLVMLPV